MGELFGHRELYAQFFLCEKQSGYCTVSSVTLPTPEFDSPVFFTMEKYPIEKWDNNHIVYINEDFYSRIIVTIDRETENICTAYKKLHEAPKNGFPLSKLEEVDYKQRDLLVDGYEVVKKLRKDAYPTYFAWGFFVLFTIVYFYTLYRVWTRKSKKED
jgi:hypothetical protein